MQFAVFATPVRAKNMTCSNRQLTLLVMLRSKQLHVTADMPGHKCHEMNSGRKNWLAMSTALSGGTTELGKGVLRLPGRPSARVL